MVCASSMRGRPAEFEWHLQGLMAVRRRSCVRLIYAATWDAGPRWVPRTTSKASASSNLAFCDHGCWTPRDRRPAELRIPVPIGYVWHREIGLGLDPDRRVQEVTRRIFQRFRELGSARQVHSALKGRGGAFPAPFRRQENDGIRLDADPISQCHLIAEDPILRRCALKRNGWRNFQRTATASSSIR
jgi:hypothetical protein